MCNQLLVTSWLQSYKVVVMEEFEKAWQPAKDALLQTISSGLYRNREDHKKINASKIIWIYILVTN